MEVSQVTGVLREMVSVILKLSAPMLLLSMVVGVFIAIVQAVTQIHEQSLAFILKLIVVISVLLIGGDWMLRTIHEFALSLYAMM